MGTMTSCSDFLDASNKSNVTAKQSFTTKEGLNNLVNNAYQHLQNVYAAIQVYVQPTLCHIMHRQPKLMKRLRGSL